LCGTTTTSKLLKIGANVNEFRARVLFDTGATHNFISTSFCDKNNIKSDSAPAMEIQLATVDAKTVTKNTVKVNLQFDGYTGEVNCYVIDIGTADVIIGMNWFREHTAANINQ
jgi:hypothetical protein